MSNELTQERNYIASRAGRFGKSLFWRDIRERVENARHDRNNAVLGEFDVVPVFSALGWNA
jgi:hypothetical protein